jgi:hypothetical protein
VAELGTDPEFVGEVAPLAESFAARSAAPVLAPGIEPATIGEVGQLRERVSDLERDLRDVTDALSALRRAFANF